MARLDTAPPPTPGRGAPADHVLARYVALLERADGQGAKRLVQRELLAGVAPAALVQQVLAPAQREIGERWYRGEWSVADEHAATAVTDVASALLPTGQDGPHVVLVAPSGEWHTLPARLAAAAAEGACTTVLGPGLPPDQLFRYLDAVGPDLVAVSCTLATNLLAAAETVRAAHDAGVPVVAGGRAFGAGPRRALALGADAWAASPAELAGLARRLVPRDDVVELPTEALLADAVPAEVLLLALERHAAASPWVAGLGERARASCLEDLRWVARHGGAALACDDPGVLDELLAWLDGLLTGREVPRRVLPDGVRYLAEALEAETPAVAVLVAEAAGRLTR